MNDHQFNNELVKAVTLSELKNTAITEFEVEVKGGLICHRCSVKRLLKAKSATPVERAIPIYVRQTKNPKLYNCAFCGKVRSLSDTNY